MKIYDIKDKEGRFFAFEIYNTFVVTGLALNPDIGAKRLRL
jgi:hypothetical protein